MHEPMDDLDSAKPLKHLFGGFKYPLQKMPVRDHAFFQIDDATRIYYKPYDCESGERGFHAEIVAMDCDPYTSEGWENKTISSPSGTLRRYSTASAHFNLEKKKTARSTIQIPPDL